MPNTQLDRRSQNTQLDRRVRYAQLEQRPSRGWKGFSSIVEGPAAWLTSFLLIPCLIAVVLLLPPVNLWDRLQLFAYTRIGVSGGVLQDGDGTLVSFPPEGVQETFYANFTSIPRIDFIEGQAGRQFYDAAVALPDYLIAKSPIYSLDVRGDAPGQAILDIPIPNDSLPYETLGVYSWNGKTWEHLPSQVLVSEDKIEATLNFLPPNFMVMQTSPDIPEVTANLNVGQELPENVRVAGEVRGNMTLRGDGALSGEVPPSNGNTLLFVSNVENGVVRSDLINNLLLDPGQQDNQLNAVEQTVLENNFRGVVLDYQQVDAAPSARADFVFLMTRMAERLHNSNKELIVKVAKPEQVSADDWNTLGYDWVALSRVVDKLVVPASLDPRAYRADGEMAALLAWATEMVERRKLQIELPTQSVETVGNYLFAKGYKEALQPLLQAVDAETNSQEVSLTADNPRLANRLTKDDSTGSYFYTYTDDQGAQRTVYLEDASSISYKLNLLRKYNLVDVTLQTPASGDIDPNIWSVLLQFQTGVALATTYDPVAVAYTVYDADNNVVTNNTRPLTDPKLTFTSPVEVAKLRVEAQLVGSRGEALSDPLSVPLAAAKTADTATAPASQESTQKATDDKATSEAPDEKIAMVESQVTLPRINANTIVNVRSGPGTTYDILGQIAPENSYQALAKDDSGQWWKIDIGGNQAGWIATEFIANPPSAEVVQVASVDRSADGRSATTAAATTEEANAKVATEVTAAAAAPEFAQVSALQVANVRNGPGTGYSVIGQINPGVAYKIVGKNEQGDWWQIEKDGQSIWVIGQLVSTAGDTSAIAVAQDIPEAPVAEQAPAEQPAAATGESAPSVAAPAAPVVAPSGGGLDFGYGVQAHMVHMGNEGQVMGLTTGMGFNWIKQQVEWRVFEGSQGARDFGALDGIINTAGASGVNVLFSVVNSPAWAREGGFDGNVGGPPANPQTYADFVGALAGKYCGTSLKMIEVWNEQNLHYEWGNKPLNPGEYVQLLAAAFNAIKGACPSMVVISGALTPAGNNGGLAMDDFSYLEQMFQAGANNYLDAVGVHPSGYNVPPWATADTACAEIQKSGNSFNGACDSPHHSWSFQSTMLGYRNIMNVYGAGGKKLVPTEFGWAAGGAFNPAYAYANDNDYNEQAEWTVQAYQMMKSWGWVGPAFLWNLNFRMVANGTEKAQWGIVDAGGGPLPAYNALAAMPK